METSTELKSFCRAEGADLVGIADLASFKEGWPTMPATLLDPYTMAISIAVRLDDNILDAIANLPTAEYSEHYRAANVELDRISSGIVEWITGHSFMAEAVPASKITDTDNLLGALSHKAVARMAGIGWQGKSLLIVSPEFGPRIRLATVLTNLPLKPDGPIENRCGACTECTKACPVSAIKNVTAEGRYKNREEALAFDRCAARTYENSKIDGIGARICGVCVRACPHGKPRT